MRPTVVDEVIDYFMKVAHGLVETCSKMIVSLVTMYEMKKNQFEAKVKTIPNPTLYMYVAPHLAAQTQVLIPGYLTEFSMWEKTHYALLYQ